jgi:LCP family protein required for cell wall assembly
MAQMDRRNEPWYPQQPRQPQRVGDEEPRRPAHAGEPSLRHSGDEEPRRPAHAGEPKLIPRRTADDEPWQPAHAAAEPKLIPQRTADDEPWQPAHAAAEPGHHSHHRLGRTGEHASGTRRGHARPAAAARVGSDGGGPARINEDLDLDEIDPRGRARHRAAARAARSTAVPSPRRKRAFRATATICAGVILALASVGTYTYEHLFGQVDTESLDSLADRPAAARADRFGNVPENILLLGSQTRDGQRGSHLGNSSKLGTDISDTAMLVHINAERKWATVVSIPRDLIVPRPACEGRLDPTQTVPAAGAAMFDLAMNLGGPTCAVATVEQMTGIRIDHFVEITFNAFQALTDAVGGVTVCVPPPGINDPNYSGLVLSPGLHTVSGPQSLAFVRDRHGLANGTDLNRIRMQQMFVTSLFNKLASAGTLGDPITLYKIADAVTSNLTVDTGLDSIDAMVGLAGSVQSLKSHYIQFITVPYGFDPGNHNRVVPGPGFDDVWTDLRDDAPLPGSNAAAMFGTTRSAPRTNPTPAAGENADATAVAAASLNGVPIDVYNSTLVPHLALYTTTNLKALGLDARIGATSKRFSGYAQTEILYPRGELALAQALRAKIVGSVMLQQSRSVSDLTLVVGQSRPAALVAAAPGGGTGRSVTDVRPAADPSASISAESRTGDENICSDLPDTVKFGGHP